MSDNYSPDQPSPALTVILVTDESFQSIRKTVQALAKQTVAERLEIIITCPSEKSLGMEESEMIPFHSTRVIEIGKIETTSQARAAGIRVAQAPYVALCEDHAFPEPAWAEAVIEAFKKGWAGVGPALTNANPGIVSWVAMVIDYGRWTEPVASGVVDDLPGHNSAWRRDLLLEYGPRLESMLPALTVLNWDLRAKGHQLYLESAAKVRHMQVSKLGPCMLEQFYVARLFPSQRSQDWPWYRRVFYILGMPVLLTRTLRGWLTQIRRIDSNREILPKSWPVLVLALVVWGLGEIAGYAFGIGQAQERTLVFDTNRIRYVNRRDRQLQATS